MEITIFKNETLNCELRTIEKEGDIWFVAKDVADMLGYSDTEKMIRRLDDDEKLTSHFGMSGQSREMIIINESGLYSSILGSKKPEAKTFKRWVTCEVLPQIRKTGGYIPINEEMSDEDILIKANEIMLRTVEKKNAIIAEQQRVKAHITAGREGSLFSKTGVLTQKVNKLEVELDKGLEYATLKRMKMLYPDIDFDWRRLKGHSILLNLKPKDVYDANYGTVKAYHNDVYYELYSVSIK
jgi:prophage antirepressor-like protein